MPARYFALFYPYKNGYFSKRTGLNYEFDTALASFPLGIL